MKSFLISDDKPHLNLLYFVRIAVHLIPDTAIVQQLPQRTFGDMRKAVRLLTPTGLQVLPFSDQLHEREAVALGCGSTFEDHSEFSGHFESVGGEVAVSRRERRRLHGANSEDCNNSTNFFCWMSCFDVPNAESAADYAGDGWSLYCLDPSVLSSSNNNVSQAVAPCTENGVMGAAMNPSCQGKWQKSVPGLPGVPVVVNHTMRVEEPFCYGATSMYMNGFNVSFRAWILKSRSL
jgi:hypothetical protein